MQSNRFGRAFACSSIKFFSLIAVLCSQLITSCINDIPEEPLEAGDVPISLTTSQKDPLGFAANGFSENDAIGLYVMVQPSSLESTRYIDNMKFSNSASTGFSPQEAIFFPEGNNKCNFISYYPYQVDAVEKGEGRIKIETPTDQSMLSSFSASDFMIATANDIATSENPVALAFSHKLFKLNIQLKAKNGYTPETLLDANPTVKIKNVYTKANYNFNTDKFSDFSGQSDIIPYGTWVIEDDMLCGKSAIIIPQELAETHIILELYIDGRLFECAVTERRTLLSGIAEDNTITLFSSSDATKVTITTNVSDWTSQQNSMEGIEAETGTVIKVSELDFYYSNVLKVMNKENQVAEICLEYLCGEQINQQAIVIYPTSNGETDLTKGIVLELKDETAIKHGGNVAWDKSSNTLTYNEGKSEAVKYIYVNRNGEIKTTRPINSIQLQIKPDVLVDKRGEKTLNYSIVKIGTQYWMRINFKPTQFKDGTTITHGGSTSSEDIVVNKTDPEYYDRSKIYFFYNTACIATGSLIPDGWRVGNENDYTRLITYITNNASVLKNIDSWGISAASNLSGFNTVRTGYYNKVFGNDKTSAAFWCANNDSPNLVDKIVTLSTSDNKITISSATTDMAVPIKCIRE